MLKRTLPLLKIGKLPRRQRFFYIFKLKHSWGYRRTWGPSRIYIYIHTFFVLYILCVIIYIYTILDSFHLILVCWEWDSHSGWWQSHIQISYNYIIYMIMYTRSTIIPQRITNQQKFWTRLTRFKVCFPWGCSLPYSETQVRCLVAWLQINHEGSWGFS